MFRRTLALFFVVLTTACPDVILRAPDFDNGALGHYIYYANPGYRVEAGDYFTLYDLTGFAGVVSVTDVAAGQWEYVGSLAVPGQDSQPGFADDPTVPNVSFRYIGTAAIPSNTDAQYFDVEADPPTNMLFGVPFGALRTANSGEKQATFGLVRIMVDDPPMAAPEPGTVLLLSAGLAVLALRRRVL